jgi:hypothetical protein
LTSDVITGASNQNELQQIPSGTATTTMVTAMMRICTKRIPFSLDVLRIVVVSGWLKDMLRYHNYLGGFLVASSTKNRIKSETKRSPPAMLPTLAITSAKSFSLSCNGVFSESRRKAIKSVLSEGRNAKGNKGRTHHDTAIETLCPNGNDHVGTNPFNDLTPAYYKAVRMTKQIQPRRIIPPQATSTFTVTNRTVRIKLCEAPIPECDTFLVRKLLDRIRLACRAGLIAPYIVTREEYSIAGNNVAGLEQHYIAHDNVVYVDQLFSAITENLDEAIFSLVVQSLELFLFLPVIYGSNSDDDKDSNKDSDALDPIYRGFPFRASRAEVLEEAQCERYYSANRQQNLW